MSDYIWVEVETNNYSRFLLKCQSLNINIYKVIEKDNLLIKILYKDFNKLNKILKHKAEAPPIINKSGRSFL